MKRTMLKYTVLKYINWLFYSTFLFVGLWLGQAVYNILTNGVFSVVWLYAIVTTIPMHSLTALVICGFYIYNVLKLKYRPLPVRVTYSAMLIVMGILFYDFIWIICDYFLYGSGNPLIQLSLFILGFSMLLFYDRYSFRVRLLVWNKKFVLSLSLFLSLMLVLCSTGFFHTYHSGVDPHNWIWFAGKFTAIWSWSGLLG